LTISLQRTRFRDKGLAVRPGITVAGGPQSSPEPPAAVGRACRCGFPLVQANTRHLRHLLILIKGAQPQISSGSSLVRSSPLPRVLDQHLQSIVVLPALAGGHVDPRGSVLGADVCIAVVSKLV